MRKEVNFRFQIWALLLITVSNEGLHPLTARFPLLQSEAVDLRIFMVICCCCPVTKSCQTLWDPVDCSTPGFPVLHYLPEFARIYVQLFISNTQFYPQNYPIKQI